MEYTFKDIMEIIACFVTIGGFVFAGIQLWQIKSNRKKQYEQARREKTAEMIMYYVQRVNPKTKYIEKIVANFSEEQCQDLYDCIPFNVNKETKDKLCSVCPYKEKCESSGKEICLNSKGKYVVENELLYCLRSNIISYLNTLESVLLTKDLGIVEEDIIVEQFAFLNKKKKKERALENFRVVAGGGHSYPCVEKYYQQLKDNEIEKSKKSTKKKIN